MNFENRTRLVDFMFQNDTVGLLKISKCEKEKCKKTKTVASKYRLPYKYLIVLYKPPTYTVIA